MSHASSKAKTKRLRPEADPGWRLVESLGRQVNGADVYFGITKLAKTAYVDKDQVRKIVLSLVDKGLVLYSPRRGVALTEAGLLAARKAAAHLERRWKREGYAIGGPPKKKK